MWRWSVGINSVIRASIASLPGLSHSRYCFLFLFSYRINGMTRFPEKLPVPFYFLWLCLSECGTQRSTYLSYRYRYIYMYGKFWKIFNESTRRQLHTMNSDNYLSSDHIVTLDTYLPMGHSELEDRKLSGKAWRNSNPGLKLWGIM